MKIVQLSYQQFKNTKPYFKEWSKLIRSTDFTLGKFVIILKKNDKVSQS